MQSLVNVGTLYKACSFGKLVRNVVILKSVQLKYCFIGISNGLGMVFIKKSQFSNWSHNRFRIAVVTRFWGFVKLISQSIAYLAFREARVRTCFCQTSIVVNCHRAGLSFVSSYQLLVILLGVSLTFAHKSSVKGIKQNCQIYVGMALILVNH